jgi:hypothetical protein
VPLLVDVTDYLSSGGVGTVGTDLFAGRMPATPAAAVAVERTGGLPSVRGMSSGPGKALVERPRVLVTARDPSRASAEATMIRIGALLDGLGPRTINGVTYHWAGEVQPCFLLKYDENERPILAQSFDVIRDASTSS